MRQKTYKMIKAKNKNEFLNHYIRSGSICKSAEKTGIARQTHYDWLRKDEEYRKAFAKAYDMYTDYMEEMATKRAVVGREVRVYYQGKLVDKRYEPSDNLLKFLLEARRPEKFRPAPMQISQNVNIDISAVVAAARKRVANADDAEQ